MSNFNEIAFRWIYGLSHHNVFLDDLGIFFAQYVPYLLILGFLVLIYYEESSRKRLYRFAEAAIAVILSRGIITEAIRFFYHHPRPFDALGIPALISENGWSFPSGHATFYFALAMIVWYGNRKWGSWYFVLATIMGVARIYVGVHWPLDILGGAVIGILSAIVTRAMLKESRIGLYAADRSAG